jgi:ribosomal protein RSM22 (predicted rRNA methylase)
VPLPLTRALDAVLEGLDAPALRRETLRLIDVYRSGAPPTEQVLRDPVAAAAYAAYRMPATHAAVGRALCQSLAVVTEAPVASLVDLGGGTGAAAWAVAEALPALREVTVLDGSGDALALGRRIGTHGPPAVAGATWTRARIVPGLTLPAADLVSVAYVLGELDDAGAGAAIDAAAAAASWVLVVEPGTPRGYAAVLAARGRLLAAGWHVVAPCPHDGPCPVAARPGDWCHFSARLDRTALHRRLKGGERGHEDEKFSFVLASRGAVPSRPGRVVRHPVQRKGLVQLQVCTAESGLQVATVTRRDRETYRAARDVDWGDAWPPATDPGT